MTIVPDVGSPTIQVLVPSRVMGLGLGASTQVTPSLYNPPVQGSLDPTTGSPLMRLPPPNQPVPRGD